MYGISWSFLYGREVCSVECIRSLSGERARGTTAHLKGSCFIPWAVYYRTSPADHRYVLRYSTRDVLRVRAALATSWTRHGTTLRFNFSSRLWRTEPGFILLYVTDHFPWTSLSQIFRFYNEINFLFKFAHEYNLFNFSFHLSWEMEMF